ncbi:MAG: hypothetical protein ACFFCS_06200 [Candidatus Hodarchaeota archaeon]
MEKVIEISSKTSKYLETQLGKEFSGLAWFKHVLLFCTTQELHELLGVPLEKARSIKNWLESNLINPFQVIRPDTFDKSASGQPIPPVPMKSNNFNELIGGGFQGGFIYNIFGPPASGKTQVCFQLIVDFLNHSEFKGQEVMFIDSDLTFRPERVIQVSGTPGILNKILVSKCYSSDHLLTILKNMESMLENGKPVPLIIFDSLLSNYFSVYVDDSLKRHVVLLEIMENLKFLARKYKSCVVFTNRVGPGILTPAGGNILIDYSDFIISLNKPVASKDILEVRLIKSPNQPENVKEFKITTSGIQDA